MTDQSLPSRRAALAAGGAATAMIVTGCSTYSASGGGGGSAPASNDSQPAPNDAGQGGASLGPASSVPVGGGRVFADQKVVVTQPAAGQFKAFSAVCTHQGCAVNAVAGGTINCPCHGSKFKVADGSVANGPAKRPLDARKVSADGGTLRLT